MENAAKEYQLFGCQAGILASAFFIPRTFAGRTGVEQVPTASRGWQCILPKQMAQTNLVIVEVASWAMAVENDGVIWYHKSEPFL